ncbi:MAG: Hpt domain-containing protein [Aquabacterium sp.]|nr:Hpt domain-containing protein [Aquabacterium sp.]
MTSPSPPPSDPQAAANAEPARQPEDAVLDAAALANLAQLDPTGANRLMHRVLTTYRSSMARMLAQLAQARAEPDIATQRLVVHTLKSSSASVGALLLAQMCSEAEKALHDGRFDDMPGLLDQLVAEAARVDCAVLQLLADT